MIKYILIVISILSLVWVADGLYNFIDTFHVYSQAMRELELAGKTPYMNYYWRLVGMASSGLFLPISILTTCILYLKHHKYRKISLWIMLFFIGLLIFGIFYQVWSLSQISRN